MNIVVVILQVVLVYSRLNTKEQHTTRVQKSVGTRSHSVPFTAITTPIVDGFITQKVSF